MALNGLVESLWRQRVLQLDLSDAVPAGFFGITAVRIDGRLPPVIVPTDVGSPQLMLLQIGEVDLFVDLEDSAEPARYVMSLRVGLDLAQEGGRIRSVADEEIDVRVEYVARDQEEPPLDTDLIATLVEGQLGQELISNISGALEVNLSGITIGLDALGEWIPSVSRIEIKPSWPEAPSIRRGWVILPADAAFLIHPADPN